MIATQTSAMSGAAPISELRPRLRRDIAYVPGDRGIVFRSADTVFSINGAGTYELLSKLLPRLDGTRTVGEMCGHLPTGQADVVARLIAALYERDVLRNVVSEPALLTPAQERRFAAQIGFLE